MPYSETLESELEFLRSVESDTMTYRELSEKINGYIVYDDVTASIVRAGRRSYVEFDRNSELSGVLGATAFLRWLSSH